MKQETSSHQQWQVITCSGNVCHKKGSLSAWDIVQVCLVSIPLLWPHLGLSEMVASTVVWYVLIGLYGISFLYKAAKGVLDLLPLLLILTSVLLLFR